MSAPQAAATGNLAKTPVPELLVYALDHALEGTLVLEEPDGAKSAILFQAGAPAKAKTATPVAYLGQVLVEQEAIDQATYQRVLGQMSQQQKLFGQLLVSQKLIDNRTLLEALREQVTQKVSHLFKLPGDTVFGFYSKNDFLARWGGPPTRVKPLPLLWRGLRVFADDARVEALTNRIGDRQLKMHFEAPIGRFKLTPQERGVVDVLRARPCTLPALLQSGLGSPMLVKRVVYALALTRQLDFGMAGVEPVGLEEAPSSTRLPVYRPAATPSRASKPSFSPRQFVPSQKEGPSEATPVAPAELSAELSALKDELLERASVDGQTYYEVLEVPNDATAPVVQAAFFKLAKVWHPDKLPKELGELREQCTKLFARISEAHQTLSDVQRRREYDELLAGGADTADEQEQVAQVLRAATAFQRAEVLLKKKDVEGAEREALEAMKGDPTQLQYKALYAWVCAQKPRQNYEDSVTMLNQVLEADPVNQAALWYRGQLHKRSERPNRALRDFKKLIELNPKHLDALREIRLHEMRKSGGREEKGLLGKWFKR